MSVLEQYEAFLKFNHDQIQRRFNGDTTASCKFLFGFLFIINGKFSEILNTFLFLFSNNMLVFGAEFHKMLVRIANSEDPDQTAFSKAGSGFQQDFRFFSRLVGRSDPWSK